MVGSTSVSVIIPVYNRPVELDELLESLTRQSVSDFEVIVVDDGSDEKSDLICDKYSDKLSVKYFYKENTGPGPSRNYGAQKAKGDLMIFFDSDCIIPDHYMAMLKDEKTDFDAFGGPDRDHPSFTGIQKAISYSMTSFFTTGGIRGGKKTLEKFHPRSFNMGITRNVFEKTGGYSDMRFGEDIDLSIRIVKEGFRSVLIPGCFVYHKRRTDFKKFFKQVFNSGVARINLHKRHPGSMKVVHFLPALFTMYMILAVPHAMYHRDALVLAPLALFWTALFFDSLLKIRQLHVAFLSIIAGTVQLTGYGLGFLKGVWKRLILGKGEFHDFKKNFYK